MDVVLHYLAVDMKDQLVDWEMINTGLKNRFTEPYLRGLIDIMTTVAPHVVEYEIDDGEKYVAATGYGLLFHNKGGFQSLYSEKAAEK